MTASVTLSNSSWESWFDPSQGIPISWATYYAVKISSYAILTAGAIFCCLKCGRKTVEIELDQPITITESALRERTGEIVKIITEGSTKAKTKFDPKNPDHFIAAVKSAIKKGDQGARARAQLVKVYSNHLDIQSQVQRAYADLVAYDAPKTKQS